MKIKMMLIIFFIIVFCSNCVSVKYPAAHDKVFPADGRYEILGSVSCTGNTVGILGIFWFGGLRYLDLGVEAERKFETKVNDVVNVTVDNNVVSVFGIITVIDTTLRGTAIRYTDIPSPQSTTEFLIKE